MTEEEAKTKWCPMSRLAWLNEDMGKTAITANRWGHGEPLGGSTCIGSACMMWRWDYPKGEKHFDAEGSLRKDVDFRLGYCGLAGKT